MSNFDFIGWCSNVIRSFANVWNWLSTPITFGTFTFTPIYIIGGGVLIAFITIAAIKWIAS